MKALIVGGGGREHALAWKLHEDDPSIEIIAAPGNPGIAALGRCVPVSADDVAAIVSLATRERPELVVIGPEAPLAAGLADALRAAGIPVFGPSRAAARIESSKAFAKALMREAGVPTARAVRSVDAAAAKRAARDFGAPVVIKASGLAAGKGVIVCDTIEAADAAIDSMLRDDSFGAAGREVLVEEFMEGEELSLFAITDGTDVLPMLAAQDHKRLLEGDRGPNTGGMGAYAPVSLGTPSVVTDAIDRVFLPTLEALRAAGAPFTGLLYAGLMLTAQGPRVVEFNARFGDPETEAILPLLESSLLDPLLAVANGDKLSGLARLRWSEGHAVTTVVAASGYPEKPKRGSPITLPASEPGMSHLSRRHRPRCKRRAGHYGWPSVRRDRRWANAREGARGECARRRRRSSSTANSSAATLAGGSRSAVPELPETETIARDLDRAVSGATIASVKVHRPDVLRDATAAALSRRVAGARIRAELPSRQAVVILLSTGDRIVVQPRFTGALCDDGSLPADATSYVTLAFALDRRQVAALSRHAPARHARPHVAGEIRKVR